jgi:hypothetical protein
MLIPRPNVNHLVNPQRAITLVIQPPMDTDLSEAMEAVEYGSDNFKVELDGHPDTCCVGPDVLIVNETRRNVKVTPSLKSVGTITKVPHVTAVNAYDDRKSGQVYIFPASSLTLSGNGSLLALFHAIAIEES